MTTAKMTSNISESKNVDSNYIKMSHILSTKLKDVLSQEITISYDFVFEIVNRHMKNLDTKYINPEEITSDIITTCTNVMKLNDLYYYISDRLATKVSHHPDYNKLAARIAVERLHISTPENYLDVVCMLYNNHDRHNKSCPLVSDQLYRIVVENAEEIQNKLDMSRDFEFDYFAIRTLERSYLFRIYDPKALKYYKDERNGKIIERPQHMIMRVAIGIHGEDLKLAFETYDLISQKYFIHATPTLFNCGTRRSQLSSCFLLSMEDDIEGIFKTITDIGFISKWSGGIGVDISSIRARGSIIRGTNGLSDGVIPLCTVLNRVGKYINQGGKRNGSISTYMQLWHADVYQFIELRKNTKDEDSKARDLFLALFVPDLFWKRIEQNGVWSLMCPDECPGLVTSYGEQFERLYLKYENEKRYRKQVRAIDLLFHIMDAQMETGVPYMTNKDHINHKSNQKNIGPIRSSNLCVAGNTKILTKEGIVEIEKVCNNKVDIWNGSEWSEVTVKQTGTNQNLLKVYFSNGAELECTPEHKFYIKNNDKIEVVAAGDLNIGSKLINWELPKIDIYNDKIVEILTIHSRFDNNSNLVVEGSHDMLNQIRLLLQTINIETPINDNYILIDKYQQVKLAHLNLNLPINRNLEDYGEEKKHDVYIQHILSASRGVNTYCFTEPKKHMGLFNGILTGQCAEITEVTDKESIAVCNLASISLPAFLEEREGKLEYNFNKLMHVARVATRNLNKVIDVNFYPTPETKYTNLKHRPIGLGVQGLVDVYNRLGLPFGSQEAYLLNKKIFETIYYGSLYESCEIAKKEGAYETFRGSPFSEGKLQYHLWGLTEKDLTMKEMKEMKEWNWESLIEDIKKYGTRNSLLTALMPTATTSQILSNFESFEPPMSNIFIRSTLAGEFIVVNEHLVRDLLKRNIWSNDLRKLLIIKNGSIEGIDIIPKDLQEIYKTAFEIKQKDIITQSAQRGPFIDQSQSMNLFMAESNFDILMSAHYDAWKLGLKTGMYYLRSRPAVDPIQFGIDIEEVNKLTNAFGVKDDTIKLVPKTPKDNIQEDKIDIIEEEPVRMCKIRPGQKIEGCDVCSA
jgi:ribonucleotide reductase alpha subunit